MEKTAQSQRQRDRQLLHARMVAQLSSRMEKLELRVKTVNQELEDLLDLLDLLDPGENPDSLEKWDHQEKDDREKWVRRDFPDQE